MKARKYFFALPALALAGLLGLTTLVGCGEADSPAEPLAGSNMQPVAATDAPPAISPGTYRLDAAHSEVGFRVKHLGISTVTGTFEEVDAVISVPAASLKGMKAETTVQTASINTNEADRDDHLRSPDFFGVAQYPALTFKSTSVTPLEGGRFLMKGDLTIRDVTRPVELEGTYQGSAIDPWGNEKIAFTAEGAINRKDFGLTWNKALETGGLLVGEEVKLVMDVQAARQNP